MEKLFKNVQPSIDERDSFSELPDLKKPMQAIDFSNVCTLIILFL
jgi:hypothetical protein